MPPKVSEIKARQEEVSAIKNKLSETETQLKEEKRIHAKLRYDAEQKQQQVNVIENLITVEQEKHKWNVEKIVSSVQALKESCERQIRMLAAQERQIADETSSMDLLMRDNERLQIKLKGLAFEHFKMKKRAHKDLELRKQNSFEIRMTMEEVLRNTIKTLKENYKDQAFAKMDGESANAARENVKLYAEYDKREEACENLIRQQKVSYEQLIKIKIAKEVLSATTNMHEQSAEALYKRKEEHHRRIEIFTYLTEGLEKEIKHLSAKVARKRQLMAELYKVNSEIDEVKEIRRSSCREVLEIGRKIFHEGLKLAAMTRAYHSHQLASSFLGGADETVGLLATGGTINRVGNNTDSLPIIRPSKMLIAEGCSSMREERISNLPSLVIDIPRSSRPSSGQSPVSQMSTRVSSPALMTDPKIIAATKVDAFDPSSVWNSSQSDCNITSASLRKLMRRHNKR